MEIWFACRRFEFKRKFMACIQMIPGSGRFFGRQNTGPDLNSVIAMDQGDMQESLLEG